MTKHSGQAILTNLLDANRIEIHSHRLQKKHKEATPANIAAALRNARTIGTSDVKRGNTSRDKRAASEIICTLNGRDFNVLLGKHVTKPGHLFVITAFHPIGHNQWLDTKNRKSAS